ncbi:hypothetical protein BDW59DRAFT_161069 [Aspergillus cavernicola]|uniref:Carrier domain-containing protein n=1 Tax=Aspergillus cavernicola TaxID=176166 RepID=A0ABR4IF49_9EURO
MAQTTPCCLPRFESATQPSQRPLSLRVNPNAGDDARLLSAWRDNKLSAVIQATWGMILRCYIDSEVMCFGYCHINSGVSPSAAKLTTMRLAIDDGDFATTLVAKANTFAVDEGRNALSDGHQLYNTVVLIRSYVANSKGAIVSSPPSALALALPQECLLRLHVKVLRDKVRIFLEWRNDGMSMEYVKGIASLFQNLLTQVLLPVDIRVADLDIFTDLDWQRISTWNDPSPQPHDRCIHDIIREQVIHRPHDEAICAWDGALSYRELDRQASTLAYHLQAQGVGPEVLVPLCFDKSMWYFVALLAVLKAGGAFVPLDPSHPPARLQSLIHKVDAKLILCSEWHADRLLGLVEIVIPLSQSNFDRIPRAPVGFISSDEVNCRNAAYVIFTSGSTGEPKGTLLEHRAYCSSAMVHGPRLLIFPESRVLQFAAHTFDASLAESISPLMHGASVCIPSEDDRLNDIVGAIKRLRANYASLTPSFIEFLEPSMVPEIQTLILAGEAMNESHRAKWSTINLVNGFGPTEASVTAAINSRVTATTDCRDIGLPLNTCCWIVNPEDANRLVPVGAVGEMLLEGPTLARGYHKNPEKTAEAFIYDPDFVRRGSAASQSRRRFYKTGDLVRYNSDSGSLTYIGRKDTQVKLHGQRVELGEIEGCLNADALTKHSVAFVPKEGYAKGKLTAVLSLNRDDDSQSTLTSLGLLSPELHEQAVVALRERLSGRLPTYMVPAIWICVDDMPFLPSRKLDRKKILSWLARLDRDPYRTETTMKYIANPELPTDKVERQLVQVWSRLLNIPFEQIPLHESFLKLGGDSIAAMTCMNQCQKNGIAVSVQDILRSTSIHDLATHAKATSTAVSAAYKDKVDQLFDLSPIQSLHFRVRQEGQGYFNQSIRTRLNRDVDASTLHEAVESLVHKHSMLRARFMQSAFDGTIRQRITNDVAGSYRWGNHQLDSESEIDEVVAASQASLSCWSGPLLAVDLFNIRGGRRVLSMVAHHLVVDIVSWRILLEDLEETLLNPDISQRLNPSLPFQIWLQLQSEQYFAYWGIQKEQIVYGDVKCASFSLDANTTSLLMAECHDSLRTEPVDVLLAAMLFSFNQTFPDRPLPVIYNEGHGREPWDTSIDISRTVGWFTTLCPIHIDQTKDAVDAVGRVKDCRRRVSDNGRACFARRALRTSPHSAHDCPMEVNLNYLGQQRDLQRTDGVFQLAGQMAGETRVGGGSADFGRETPRFSLFEVSAVVIAGQLRFVFSFSASMKHQTRVQQWVAFCKQVLESLAVKLPSLTPRHTLSDFPLLTLTYPELSLLETHKLHRYGITSIDQVEDIYPCSKMQQGVLLSQARDPLLYAVSGTWEVQPTSGGPRPDVQRLIEAWNQVVDHHAMLRTVFATGLSRKHPFSHIVLKQYISTPVLLQCSGDESLLSMLQDQPLADYRATRPPHRFTVGQSTSGKIICKLELSHAAMDGSSISLLLRDLQLAYAGGLAGTRKSVFKDYIHYLQHQPTQRGIDHWCAYLAGTEACHLPSDMPNALCRKSLQSIRLHFDAFAELQSFCANHNLTVANAFNAAWALTLAHFCQSEEVCFSYTASLRDAPVPGIDSVVGPAMNLLVCRLHTGTSNIVDLLRQTQDDYMDNFPHRHVSLIDIQHAIRTSRTSLFNTGVSYRKLPTEDGPSAAIQFQARGLIHDPSEISVYVNIEATDVDAQLELNYWNNWLSDTQAQKVADIFLESLAGITHPSLTREDISRISEWNRAAVQQPNYCIHAGIEAQALKIPDTIAIATTKQELTYARINYLSSALASYMISLGVLPGSDVPFSFDQSDSQWAVISVLAIWKAGGICVPIDSNLLDKDLEAYVALASPGRGPALEEIAAYVIPMTRDFLEVLETDCLAFQQPQLTETAYILHPGLILDHNAVASSCQSFAESIDIGNNTRMLQLADISSYKFLLEVFATLAYGGCVCIPHTNSVDDVLESVVSLQATVIQIPTLSAASINLADAHGLRRVILTGCSPGLETDKFRAPQAELYAFFGGAECLPACLLWSESKKLLTANAPSVRTWIVDPSDHDALLPVGAIGELLVEGPMLASGYLFNETGTDGWIEDPAWLSLVDSSTTTTGRRLFKTGILVQYGADGSVIYRGCKGQSLALQAPQNVGNVVVGALTTDVGYWKEYLTGIEPCIFPPLTEDSAEEERTSLARLVIEHVDDMRDLCQQNEISPAAVFQLTWGIILRCYTGLIDVCYGFSETDHNSLLPMAVSLEDHRGINESLKDMESSMKVGASHRLPLSEVLESRSNTNADVFNTVLYVKDCKGSSTKRSSHLRGISKAPYAITVRIDMSKSTCVVEILFLQEALPETYADSIAVCFEHVLGQIMAGISSNTAIGDIDFLDEYTGALLRDWNRSLPQPCEECVHNLIAMQAQRLPASAPAICAWDGDLTYSQLEIHATRLAQNLQRLGVGPGLFVALCFNKSAWAVVAQLAVLKAGGAFASLDPAHPEGRLQNLVADLSPKVILTSSACSGKLANIGAQTFVVSQSTIAQLPMVPGALRSRVTPSNAAYAIFTSGTTGMPKATVLEHTALSTTSLQLAKHLGLDSTTRTLQFSSYSFDVSVLDIHGTLINGGCVCIPSDNERVNDLAGAIRRMGVTHWNSTPGIANTIDPKSIPSLATIVTGGEKMSPGHIERWSDRCVINAYGPSETTIIATLSIKVDRQGTTSKDSRGSIGKPICGRSWVVDPYNPQRLLPVGAVGELVLEGCNVARGYLNSEEKTRQAFIEQPEWSHHESLKDTLVAQERMYRTGDLVRYNPQGTLTFISRMDTQVKLNGQRIELEEIEIQCLLALPPDSQVVVDIIASKGKAVRSLAVFFCTPEYVVEGSNNEFLLDMKPSQSATANHVFRTIQDTLPQYMVPHLFFPVHHIPCNTSAKIDRPRLRSLIEELSKEQLKPYTAAAVSIVAVDTGVGSPQISSCAGSDASPSALSSRSSFSSISAIEEPPTVDSKLRELWAEVLGVESGSVSADDNFFGLGGDSFTAMSLVSAAQAEGLSLSVAEIFQYPVLEDMLKCCQTSDDPIQSSQFLAPFTLLPDGTNLDELLEEVANTCSIPKTSICDVYPCSALQEGLITASIQQAGAYVAHPVFQLSQDVDIPTFKAAWQKTINETEVLRTRILHTATANFVQVVIQPSPSDWARPAGLVATQVGGPLTGYTITDNGYSRSFTWSIHHALYDGWSIPLILRRVEENYEMCRNGAQHPSTDGMVPYSVFIDHLQKQDNSASDAFWRTYLANMSSPAFPATKNALSSSINASSRHYATATLVPERKDITLPAMIRAAWAIVLSVHTESADVCFGETLMGRNIDLQGVSKIAGPLLTTVPTRIVADSDMQLSTYLERVHQSAVTMIPHQHTGLQEIRKMNEDTAKACDFQNLLVIQTAEQDLNSGIWTPESTETNHAFFTYPLTLECRLAGTVEITAYFDDRIISAWCVKRLIAQLIVVLSQLTASAPFDQTRLSDLDVISPDDRDDMNRWNQEFAPCVDRTIHDLIHDQQLLSPDAPSVASWDGNLSYRQLLDTASGFAGHLSSLGVGPEVLVPICMDKSVWMVVTIMSILIAGGAFVPLDPAHPTSRHEEILEETRAKIVLCTPKYLSRYIGKVPTVVGVDQQTVKKHQGRRGIVAPSATSDNVAYSIFTSGSTGRPKGIIIEHRAFASSTMAYGPIIHLEPGIRVFQFASLTFDAAVMEILGTLIYGGCVCIPSDEERLNDIAGAIRRLDASWLFCTPSLASIMEPSSVPSLKVIVCGGEMMSHEAMEKWSDKVHFINAYGPTETSVYATFNPSIGKDRNPANIGHTIPSTLAWIVDPENYNRLYPVGSVGELALEGPVLAREYLKNPQKTANAFIMNPKWAQDARPDAAARRIYLTGDLARLTDDGSLEYVGRKDHQVKLHGQRMELGEIEYRLHKHPHVRHAVVLLPKTGRLQKRLVAILSLNSLSTKTSLISSANCTLIDETSMHRRGMAELLEVQSGLETQLPPYMVPQTWAVIDTLPMLVSGKIDRKKITAWVEGVDDATYHRVMGDYDRIKRGEVAGPTPSLVPKQDDTESVLQEILARVLNMEADQVDLDRSFTSLGGDSITGMAIVSHARKQGITLLLGDILQAASVRELVRAAEAGVSKVNLTEHCNVWFDLSAIQRLYFDYATQYKGSSRFNQSITLRLPQMVEPNVIENGLREIVMRHSMLRVQFRQLNGKWEQRIGTSVDDAYRFQATTLQQQHDMKQMIAMTQNTIDVHDGPTFAANLFEVPGVDQILFLVASHLCVDMVSWRLILQDLEEFVKTGSLTVDRPFPFQTWCKMQLEHCTEGDYQSHLPFTVVPSDPEYWGMREVPNHYGDVYIKKFSLSPKETALALHRCHTPLRTEPLDLFLAVVMHSFRRTFTDRQLPTVYNEMHGRQLWDSSIDLSGTVGWFTSICPLHLALVSDEILQTLRMVKDARRKTVNQGSSFFAQQVLSPTSQPKSPSMDLPVEIVFNYLGKLQQLERDDSLFQHYGNLYDEDDFMVAGDMGPHTPRFALFEISAIVVRDQLQFSFTFNKNMRHQAQISSWITECEMTLYEALDVLKQTTQLEVMPSDYPLLSISQSRLQTLFNETLPKLGVHSRDVEDIYPCSTMQEGIMFSQLRDPSAYMLHTVFNIRNKHDGSPINIPRLRKAWQMVVDRHSALRTIFVDSNSNDGSFDQIVLKHLHADLIELECSNPNTMEQLERVSLEETNRKRSLKQLHQLTVVKTATGTTVMKLEMNHAIIDGASVGILLRDFSLAYERRLPIQPGPLYRNYIAQMRAHPEQQGIQFWMEYLRGIRPCHLPVSGHGPRELKSVKMDFHRFAELRQLSQRESVTVANLVLAAWAVVLRQSTGEDVCFGYVSAGRDAPVPAIQDTIGLFINMLCCRIRLPAGQPFTNIFKTVQADFFRSTPYQSCSLAAVQNELGLAGQMLFNTAVSIQNQMPSAGSERDALSFDIQEAYDPSEFPVTVNAVTAQGGEGILLRYWSDAISDGQAHSLASSIAQVFTAFIEDSSRPISTCKGLSTAQLEGEDRLQSGTRLRRRSSVKSRRSRLSINDPVIQEQINQRVNEILSEMLKQDELPGVQRPHRVSLAHLEGDATSETPISPLSQRASICRRLSTISRASRRRISVDLERKLRVLWSTALDVPVDTVDRQDSFFRVGGDSIKAMKMASAAREDGLVLTVTEVFRNPIFEDMLTVICSTNIVHSAPIVSDGPSYDIMDGMASSGSVSRQSVQLPTNPDLEATALQADICPKIGFFKGAISDVLPVTDFQALSLTAQLFESRWMLNYFYLDGAGQLDLKRLRESCARVVDAFDILRTVFVCSGDHFYQVILKKVRPSIIIYETQTDLDTFTASLQQRDRAQGLRQGEQFVQFVVAKRIGTPQHRLLVRLSHAQYDGMCISKILDAIKQGYEGGTLRQTISFANYMRLLPSSITPEHYEYWTTLLKGSRMTDIIARDHVNTYQTMGAYAEVKTTIDIGPSARIGHITTGTLVQAAWALTLAKLSADADVVFGLTINGRNASIPGVQDTVGPCLNMIPVRVTFANKWNGLDLIRYLQDQLVATMPYESLGFREIIQRCTNWPSSTYFSTAVLHQNVDYDGHMDLDNTPYRVGGAGVIDNLADLTLVSKSAESNQLNLSLGYSFKGPITEVFASRVLQLVCDTIITLTSNPTAQLPSPNTLRSLPPQTIPDLPRVSDQQLLTSQLKSQNISDILVHSAILSRTWQQVLPSMYSKQRTFQLDTSFYDLGGDVFSLGQATWLLQQEGYQVRIEDLLDRPTFLGHMAVLAQDAMGQPLQDDITDVNRGELSVAVEKTEKKVRWKKAFGIMGKFSKRESISS